MPNKTQEYLNLAQQTAKELTRYWENWTDYLTTASRLYKYNYADQLMIYAQRPDATACASFDLWNDRMNRYVRRGSKGIALLDQSSSVPRLHYVFDVSDTGVRRNSRDPEVWQLGPDLMQPVSEMLAREYGVHHENLGQQIADVCGKLVDSYWDNNSGDILDIVDGSLLMDYDEAGQEFQFKSAAAISITYTVLERCGFEPAGHFDRDDFQAIFSFSTPAAVYVLGTAVSECSRDVLRNIERTVKTTIRRRNVERSQYEYEQPERDLLDHRGLPAPEPDPAPAGESTGQVRTTAPDLPDEASPGAVQLDAPVGDSASAPAGSGADRREPDAPDHAGTAETEPGSEQGAASDGVGAAHEQPESTGRGAGDERADLQLSFFDAHIPTEAEQIESIDQAESEKSPSAFSLSQAEIENALRRGSNFENSKLRIWKIYQLQPDRKLRAKALAKEYAPNGPGGSSHTYLDGSSGWLDHDSKGLTFEHYPDHQKTLLRWNQVEKYIDLMIQSDRYLSDKEKRTIEFPLELNAASAAEYTALKEQYPDTLVGFEAGGNFMFYGEDAVKVSKIINGILLTEKTALGEVKVSGFSPSLWARKSKELWSAGNNVYLAGLSENGTHHQTKYLRKEDYLPIGSVINMDGREFRVDGVDFDKGKVSLQDMALADVRMPIFREESLSLVRELYEQQDEALDAAPEKAVDYKVGDSVVVDLPTKTIEGTIGYVGETDVRIDTSAQGYSWSNEVLNKQQFEDGLRQDEPTSDESLDKLPISGEVNGEWQTFPDAAALDEALNAEPAPEPAGNFHITDDHLGEGGAKQKYARNIAAIRTLFQLEQEHRGATAEEQEVLSQYVGWGGLPDAFDPDKSNWSKEYTELKGLLSEDEYAAARSSVLNAHYTSPTVIRSIYVTVERMGFRSGNILEPSMGVGNFFGMLPESMADSRLYGVELDSITGRIAQKLYPEANIKVAGFETTDRRDFYDLAVGNVPFGNYKVNDKSYNKLNFSIHNYFFAKAIDQVRPGGVVAFVTSRYTLDSKDSSARKHMAERADLLGAIRLPNNAFRANAGTDVVSDIIFLQKRDRPIDHEPDWIQLGKTEDGLTINSYFVDHPEMVLGELTTESTQYGREECTVRPIEDAVLADQLAEAIQHIEGLYTEVEVETPDIADAENERHILPADPDVKNFSYTVVDGEVYYRENSVMTQVELSDTAKGRVTGMVELRQIVNELIDQQLNDYPDADIQATQEKLNAAYDAFSAKYGLLNDRKNGRLFEQDSSYYLLCSLENLDEQGQLKSKAAMFTKRTIRPECTVTNVDTPTEALAVSIGECGRVDLPYMAELLGTPGEYERITSELSGVIFKDPGTDPTDPETGWQMADEYLSGNVRAKLRMAQLAAETNPEFAVNVTALEKAQPKDLEASEIDVRLGATWLDPSIIQKFMAETFQIPYYLRHAVKVRYSPYTAEWRIEGKSAMGRGDITSTETYGTSRTNAYKILEDTLNLKDVRIYDAIEDEKGRPKRVLNKTDRLFVDESHFYKNLFLTTKMRNVAGLSTSEAQKSSDMFGKCRYLDEITGGRGAVFATGTPVSNSMSELYTVMRYLQYGTLQQKGLTHFDCWASTFGETTTAIELAPEGTGYRAKTRFARFFNLPELISLFKESADVQTADMLNLPVPQAEYINEVLKPSEIQEEMVSSFADRAEAVRNGSVNPKSDNMLKITNDGRKLALDQRLMNEMLPDEPESKVNRCVDNAFEVWEESSADKGTQLIFCDLSTPKNDGTFNVYDDVREKLVARGVPREEVAFIHEYNTETKKAELFAKVRAGQVRILMGSTPKLGAGTNIQDRLIALHHLDCPWKPSDLEQQEGRILRQGNRNKQVKIYRYVTENTFDSYMWQILENKQKFISQIMTSKSPVRACDDVDDTALSYAEIKALATGNPYIKEKMDLDIQVSKLKLLKANHTSQIYSLESDIARRYPREITVAQGQIEALKTDMEAAKPLLAQDKDHFSMEISGKVYSERKEAGAAIIEACKALKAAGTEGRIGSYGAFELHSRFDNFDKVFRLSIKGAWNYSMEVGKDPQGNILRVTNALAGIERTLPQVERRLETLEQQLAQAKEEAKRPFAQEAELAEKSARLAELNSLLNMDEKGSEDALGVDEDAAETEVADRPRQPVNYAGRVAERTADNVRKPSVLAQLHAKQAERSAEPQKSQKRKSHDMEL